jgi:ParB/RepB/Spo0J family partition protein
MTPRSPIAAAAARRALPVVCECEHEAHFTASFFDGPHAYSAHVPAVVDVVTPLGTFKVCRPCAETCLAVYATPSEEPIPMTASAPDDRLGRLAMVPLASVRASGLHPRLALDEAALNELAHAIAEDGVHEPLLVRPIQDGPTLVYQVADGHRRLRAAERAKRDPIPVRIRSMTDEEFKREVALANLGRENLTPLEEAQAFASLLDGNGGGPVCTVAELAALTGKTDTFVYQRLKLRELRPDVAALLTDGTLPLAHALLIARVPADRQRAAVLGGVYGLGSGGLREDDGAQPLRKLLPTIWGGTHSGLVRPPGTLGELRRWIEEEIHLALTTAPFPTADAELVPAAGSCSMCPKRTGFQPALFPELAAGKDACTDGACFAGKTDAHVARTIQEYKARGVKLAKVTAGDVRGTAAAKRGEWAKAAAGAKRAVQVIHVADGKAGAVEWATITRVAPTARPAPAAGDASPAKATKAPKQRPPWEDDDKIGEAVRGLIAERATDPGLHQEIASHAIAALDPRVVAAIGYALGRALRYGDGYPCIDKRQRITAPWIASVRDCADLWFDALHKAKALRGSFDRETPTDVTAAASLLTFTAWYVTAAPSPAELEKQALARLKAAAAPATPAGAAVSGQRTPKGRPVKKGAKR